MADPEGPRLLSAAAGLEVRATDRYSQVVRVLYRVLVLNLAVAGVKIVLGYATGAVSILSDGFHSLTDSASNVVGLVGVSIARRTRTIRTATGNTRRWPRSASWCS